LESQAREEKVKTALRLTIAAFVLMANHYHLIVETPKANLSSFMHSLNSAYTTYFNIRRKRAGHLFQGRYKAILCDKGKTSGVRLENCICENRVIWFNHGTEAEN
jgi:REP element-mobilizing transposase RayT